MLQIVETAVWSSSVKFAGILWPVHDYSDFCGLIHQNNGHRLSLHLVCDTSSGLVVNFGLPEHVDLEIGTMKAMCMDSGYATGGIVLEKLFLKLICMCIGVHSGAYLIGSVTSSKSARNCGPVECDSM